MYVTTVTTTTTNTYITAPIVAANGPVVWDSPSNWSWGSPTTWTWTTGTPGITAGKMTCTSTPYTAAAHRDAARVKAASYRRVIAKRPSTKRPATAKRAASAKRAAATKSTKRTATTKRAATTKRTTTTKTTAVRPQGHTMVRWVPSTSWGRTAAAKKTTAAPIAKQQFLLTCS